jgi:hypothetical protein
MTESYLLPSLLQTLLLYLPISFDCITYCYRTFAALEILIGLVTLYSRFGFPQFNIDFAGRVMQDSTTIYVFLGAILVMSR